MSDTRVHTVTISGFAFNPRTLVINPGDSVVWINRDGMEHTATRTDAPPFDTGPLARGQSSEPILFADPSPAEGWRYVCTPHPVHMQAVIVVQPAAEDKAEDLVSTREPVLEITSLQWTLDSVNKATLIAKGTVRTTGWTHPELVNPRIGDGILHLDFVALPPLGGAGNAITEIEARHSLPLGSQPQDITVHTETNEMSVTLPAIGEPA
jgi:plastocyanin